MIGIALILSAVFIPVAFVGGLTGQHVPAVRADDRDLGAALGLQRAVAVAGARGHAAQAAPRRQRGPLGMFFGGFNKVFDATTKGYVGRLAAARAALDPDDPARRRRGRRRRVLRPAAARRLHPRGGPGHLRRQRPAPAGGLAGAHERRCSRRSRRSSGRTEGIESYQTIGGYGVVTSTYQPNFGTIFARLKPWEERHGEALHVRGIMAELQRELAAHPGGDRLPLQHPDDLGLRRLGRLQLPAAGPQRHAERGRPRRAVARVPRGRARSGRSSGTCSRPSTRPTRRSRSTSTATRRASWACPIERGVPGHVRRAGRRLRQRLQPLRAPVPRLRAGRSRPAPRSRGHRRHLRPQRDDRRHDPALDA